MTWDALHARHREERRAGVADERRQAAEQTAQRRNDEDDRDRSGGLTVAERTRRLGEGDHCGRSVRRR